jgi:hypothetical protein
MCKHEKFKIAERLFNKFGKHVATGIYCLKCGASEKIIEPKLKRELV